MFRTISLGMVVVAALSVGGCGEGDQGGKLGNGGGTAAAAPAATEAESGMVVGRVTMADGSALRGQVKDIGLAIQGVSEAGERVYFTPVVKADGTYRQKVPPGQYSFSTSRIVVIHNDVEHSFTLEPVGMNWNKNQDSAEGISQDFVWKITGATPYGMSNGKDNGNHTHWYGRSIGLRPEGYREDIKSVPKTIPDGTKLLFTFKATGTVVDGTTLSNPIVVERTYTADFRGYYDAADLPPASYELSGTATLPDGSSVPLVFNGEAYAAPYVQNKPLKLAIDNIIGGSIFKTSVTFAID